MAVQRKTIQVPGQDRVFSPVPEGIKVGEFMFSSLLGPTGPKLSRGADVVEDAQIMFQRIRDLVAAGGGRLTISLMYPYTFLMTRTVRPSTWNGSRCFRIPRIVLPVTF